MSHRHMKGNASPQRRFLEHERQRPPCEHSLRASVLQSHRRIQDGVQLLSGIAYLLNDRLSDPAELQIATNEAVPADLRVYITGAVQNPGVYPLQDGDRWIDALGAAGGPATNADLNAVNLSRRAQDEDHIFVPPQGASAVADASQGPLININTAAEA